MTEIEMIKEMLIMQEALDMAIADDKGLVYGRSKWNKENLKLALVDEVGELNHELKKSWCWWKETQAEVNREKVLEELVDIWHFALSLYYHEKTSDSLNDNTISLEWYEKPDGYCEAIYNTVYTADGFVNANPKLFGALIALGKETGFSMDDVYKEYVKKNRVNYERLANHY